MAELFNKNKLLIAFCLLFLSAFSLFDYYDTSIYKYENVVSDDMNTSRLSMLDDLQSKLSSQNHVVNKVFITRNN